MSNFRFQHLLSIACSVFVMHATSSASEAQAQDFGTESESTANIGDNREEKILERITVAGTKEQQAVVPGSSATLDQEELDEARLGFDDVNRVLAQIPGVNIQEEEGFGRRPNIGFRGTPVERSRSITLMEDSVLIAPAPYAAPSAYYFPPIGRMEGLEVLKGASQIKYGPRTLGGSLNMFSTSIPKKFALHATAAGGSDSTYKGHLNVGDSYQYGGWMLEGYTLGTDGYKHLPNGDDTGFDLRDLIGKVRVNTAPEAEFYQQLEFKIDDYEEEADETYLGLTREDFEDDPFQRYAASQEDYLDIEHQQYQLRHYIELSSALDVTTTFYRNNTQRTWYKLESVNGSSLADILDRPAEFGEEYDWITGATSPAGALAVRDADRWYYALGVQSVLAARLDSGGVQQKIEFGLRYHEDQENRFQQDDLYSMVDGQMVLDAAGAPGSQANRVDDAEAWAFHVQDEISYGNFTLLPGLRYEMIDYSRKDYGKEDPTRSGVGLKRNSTDLDSFIPGIGAHWQASEELGAFLGVYKGFAPPGPSGTSGAEEEESVNYEIGTRYNRESFQSEAVFFWNDYDNLLGADTLSGGGSGSGDLFNAGAVTVVGFELSSTFDAGKQFDCAVDIPLKVAYTYTDAEFDTDFSSELFGTVQSGDSVPYIPEQQAYFSIGVGKEGIGKVELRGSYVDAMPTYAGAEDRGPGAKTDSYVVFDAVAEVEVAERTRIFVDLVNIFDDEFIVARRPAGARPGVPFTALAGVKFSL